MTTISEMVSRNARMYPDETALIELLPSKNLRKEITWAEFDRRIDAVAFALRQKGIQKGDRVLHWMHNSINWLEAYFGIMRTGAWVAPLNFRFTADDLAYCTGISNPKAIIFDEGFSPAVETLRQGMSSIKDYIVVGEKPADKPYEEYEEMIVHAPKSGVLPELNDWDDCGLYFTSGTTGQPKPILLTHKNMECAAITEWAHHQQRHDDNFILIPPLYHTGAKMHWFGSLMVGGKSVILREVGPKVILDAVSREKGTIVWLLVPWAYDILAAFDSGALKKGDYELDQWRLMHIGAQPVPPTLVKHWKDYFPEMQYDTNYGLSESAGPGCVHLGVENIHKVGAIGKAGFNWEARIVDEHGVDVPKRSVGELIVRGGSVMKEYYGNPEKTAETLKDGWLYTGDMARFDEQGFIFLVDRKKDVIISGGENVFPVEIEDMLHAHPKVKDVAVIGFPEPRLVEVVGAIIEPKPGVTLTEEEVLKYCDQHLPRYKRPRVIIFDSVPRNPTGKIEKPKLREKYLGHSTVL